ncbi:MAG: hypothetical protein IKG96_07330 [Bacteroidaceae bacterium]|nr:hypothetical protein [Bacteroidaceae bacterium]
MKSEIGKNEGNGQKIALFHCLKMPCLPRQHTRHSADSVPLRWYKNSTAPVQKFHCAGTKVSLRWYSCTNAVEFSWYWAANICRQAHDFNDYFVSLHLNFNLNTEKWNKPSTHSPRQPRAST